MSDILDDPRYQRVLYALIAIHESQDNPAMRPYERGQVAEFLVMLDTVRKKEEDVSST